MDENPPSPSFAKGGLGGFYRKQQEIYRHEESDDQAAFVWFPQRLPLLTIR